MTDVALPPVVLDARSGLVLSARAREATRELVFSEVWLTNLGPAWAIWTGVGFASAHGLRGERHVSRRFETLAPGAEVPVMQGGLLAAWQAEVGAGTLADVQNTVRVLVVTTATADGVVEVAVQLRIGRRGAQWLFAPHDSR